MVVKDPLKLLVVVRPFPKEGGGSYRALKSLIEYPSYGIYPYLLIPPTDYDVYDFSTLSLLKTRDVKIIDFLKYYSKNIVVRRMQTLLHLAIPKIFIGIDLKKYPRNIDAVLSFHETWDALWIAYFIASKTEKTSIAILQLPPFYVSKNRQKTLYLAFKLYYNCIYGKYSIWKFLAQLHHDMSEMLVIRNIMQILHKYSFIIGISRAICVESGLESSGRAICMDPGVSLDEQDLNLINIIRNRYREKKGYVVFGGRPTATKGIVEAFLVFRDIVKRYNNCRLVITGGIHGSRASKFLRFAKRLGIGDKVVFTGFVSREERFRIVREAKLMLYPSHVDAFPYAVAESFLLGTPVVAYDIPAIDIYYKGFEGIRIVRELDMDAMASEAIDILSRDKVDVEAPRLRPWRDIIEEEVSLIKRVVERF
ncbi:glycosyl transferase group 1 [Ignisphaera aggregans DSM 17230]|uniref:Glycosyl transferase group 1 n=1 Tax=Ignisphaera aggregans (strain DSM 17230 / JCM 13409 / AQ1.S1) TaxID=583356 RepID=E0ST08_IGNAA|nr:glycosyl transferase group 1 [Ignisphaera aggregans DSM 17230]